MKREEFASALDKVRAFIECEALLPPPSEERGECLFVAISGGADSTALLLIMKELGYKVQALHCNFHLRGEESDRDQAFVEELCRKHDVPLSVRHFQTEEYAKRHGISIEMAARELRYQWFLEEIEKLKKIKIEGVSPFHPFIFSPFIAVAHHRDDQAETLLLNLLRGTGLRGLAGMQPRHDSIIRPLLCLSRDEILAYLESKGQTYVTDSSNAERIALRNKLRLDVMPLLRDISSAVDEHLCLAADNIRHSLPYYIKGIETAFKELGITADTFPLSALSSRTLLHEWLAGNGFNRTQEGEMLQAKRCEVGKVWYSATNTVLRDREALLLILLKADEGATPLLRQEIVSCIGETGPDIAYFDADLLTAPIKVRPVREGDALVPFGMKGRKLVSNYLTDKKVNRLQKAKQFVATCGNDIIWLIGHRSDNRYRVTDATCRILKLTVANCQTNRG